MVPESIPILPRISDYPAWHAQRTPDASALILGGKRVTYAELAADIERTAAALWAAGVRKGDRVLTLQTPSPDFVLVFLATVSIGAIWVGLNPRYRLEELLHVVQDSEPRLLFARSKIDGRSYASELASLAAVPSVQRTVLFAGDPPIPGATAWDRFLSFAGIGADLEAARQATGGRDACIIVYTSGSTGRPKGAVLHHEGIAAFSEFQNRVWPVSPLRMVNYFPINHIGCLVDCTMPCLAAGGSVLFMEHFDPRGCLELMVKERATLWASVPSVFQLLLAVPNFKQFDLSDVQLIVFEGAPMPEDMLDRLAEICPRLATNYGMTETTSAITVVEPTNNHDILARSVGWPIEGVEIRITDPLGNDVPDGAPGEVLTRSKYNFLGYWRQTDTTAASFTDDGFFHTGDLAIRRPDGALRLVGRLKEMFKSGGYNVYPREIEAVLERHPGVDIAVVVPVPDRLWHEVGVAFVVGSTDLQHGELAEWCRERLANYKVPKQFILEAELPLLPIGKIDRTALKKRAARQFA